VSDLVEQLRSKHCCDGPGPCRCDEAADEIMRLRAAISLWDAREGDHPAVALAVRNEALCDLLRDILAEASNGKDYGSERALMPETLDRIRTVLGVPLVQPTFYSPRNGKDECKHCGATARHHLRGGECWPVGTVERDAIEVLRAADEAAVAT
jgi:hypothetical protein